MPADSWCLLTTYPNTDFYGTNIYAATPYTGVIGALDNESDNAIDVWFGISSPSGYVYSGVGFVGYYQTSASYPAVYNDSSTNVSFTVYSQYSGGLG